MTTPENYTTGPNSPDPDPLRFTVAEGDSALGIRPGDCLEWDGTAPAGERLSVRRTLQATDADTIDRMYRGAIVPADLSILESRRRMAAHGVADRFGDEGIAA